MSQDSNTDSQLDELAELGEDILDAEPSAAPQRPAPRGLEIELPSVESFVSDATVAHFGQAAADFDSAVEMTRKAERKSARKDKEGKYSARGEAKLAWKDVKEGFSDTSSGIGKKIWAVIKFIGKLIYAFFRSIWRLLVGIAVVAVVFCVIGAAGLGYLYLSSSSELPDISDYTKIAMPQDSTIYDADGEVIGVVSSVSRESVGFGDISQPMKDAIVSIEDERFYNHQGVDLQGIARAFYYNYQEWRSGGSATSQGASTITQQYVRNAYEQVGSEQTMSRKMTEMMLAAQIEMEMSKDDILNSYLNTIYFGNGCYGVQAAAKYYFGKPASELGYYEAAVLASIINAPSIYDPTTEDGREATAKRANLVLDKMYSLGKLEGVSQDALRELKQTELAPLLVMQEEEKQINQPYYYDYVLEELYKSYTKAQIESGGWQIYTTLSIEDGAAAEDVVRGIEESYDNGITAAIADVDVESGAVKSFCGGTDYNATQFNIATMGRLQTGSTLKPLLYAALCEYDGYYMTDDMDCSPVDVGTPDSPHIITPYISGGKASLKRGIIASDNAMAIHAAQTLGMDKFQKMAKAVGITDPIEDNVIAVIGGQTEGLTPLELASGYSTIARKGYAKDRWCIEEITDGLGNEVYSHKDSSTKVMSSEVALQVTDAMCAAVDEAGWYNIPFDKKGWQIAAKTGTTNDDMDSWCVGFDHDRAVAIWVGGRDERMTVYNSSYNTTGAFSRYFDAVGQSDKKGDFDKPQWKTEVPARESSSESLESYLEALSIKQLSADIEYVSASNASNNQLMSIEGEGQLVPRYSKVKLQVARDMVEVPDFTDMPISEAYAAAEGLSLDFDVTYSASGTSTPSVTSQSLEAGSLVATGTKITLRITLLVPSASDKTSQQVVYRGGKSAMELLAAERDKLLGEKAQLESDNKQYQEALESAGAIVPDVSGMSGTLAKQVLTSLGFSVSYTGTASDTILSTSPVAGTTVPAGSTVMLRSNSSANNGTSNTSNSANRSGSSTASNSSNNASNTSNNASNTSNSSSNGSNAYSGNGNASDSSSGYYANNTDR